MRPKPFSIRFRHGKLLKTQNDLRDQKDAMEQRISELEQENASLKEQLEAARRNGAPVAAGK